MDLFSYDIDALAKRAKLTDDYVQNQFSEQALNRFSNNLDLDVVDEVMMQMLDSMYAVTEADGALDLASTSIVKLPPDVADAMGQEFIKIKLNYQLLPATADDFNDIKN